MKRISASILALCITSTMLIADCPGDKTDTGWCYPTGTSSLGSYLKWHESNPKYPESGLHLAIDIDASEGESVYAIADGKVIHVRHNVSGYGGIGYPGTGIIIRHRKSPQQSIDALYAHLKNTTVKEGDFVAQGTRIGEISEYKGGLDHLHFGIRDPANNDNDRWAGYGKTDKGFVNPMTFFDQYSPAFAYATSANIAWIPANTSCQHATKWFHIDNGVIDEDHPIADRTRQSVDGNALCIQYSVPGQCTVDFGSSY